MVERYWLIHPNGTKQLIDPRQFDLDDLEQISRRIGGRLEREAPEPWYEPAVVSAVRNFGFEPPVSALVPLFRMRLEQIYECRIDYTLKMVERPTKRALGNYYRSRKLIRIYSHDTETGRRTTEELFQTFLHEMAHHLEYTEFDVFNARACGRKRGVMHSPLFWRILGELKNRWEGRTLAADLEETACV